MGAMIQEDFSEEATFKLGFALVRINCFTAVTSKSKAQWFNTTKVYFTLVLLILHGLTETQLQTVMQWSGLTRHP